MAAALEIKTKREAVGTGKGPQNQALLNLYFLLLEKVLESDNATTIITKTIVRHALNYMPGAVPVKR